MSPVATLALLIPLSDTVNLNLQALLWAQCFGLQHTNPFPPTSNQENKKREKEFFISFIKLIFLVVIQWFVGAIYISQPPYTTTGFIRCN